MSVKWPGSVRGSGILGCVRRADEDSLIGTLGTTSSDGI
ncbi:MAG: hypothetical protein QG608_501 [Actinomycetota bacterium]|nr:hypothetical protein [Actinomycetota bacterium]